MTPIFCFKISETARLAYDKKTGEARPCYARIDMNEQGEVDEEQYNQLHKDLAATLANQTDLELDQIALISQKEYFEEADDDEL